MGFISIEDNKLYAAAILRYGETAQWSQVQEECAELIAAISHMRRGRHEAVVEVANEIADVYIMLEQAKRMLGVALVKQCIHEKEERLYARLVEDGAL